MQNVRFEFEGGELVIRVDLGLELGESASGKSIIVATTGGNIPLPGSEEIKIGLNVFRPQSGGRGNGRSAGRRAGW